MSFVRKTLFPFYLQGSDRVPPKLKDGKNGKKDGIVARDKGWNVWNSHHSRISSFRLPLAFFHSRVGSEMVPNLKNLYEQFSDQWYRLCADCPSRKASETRLLLRSPSNTKSGRTKALGALSRILRHFARARGAGIPSARPSLPPLRQEMDHRHIITMYLLFVSYFSTPYDLPPYGRTLISTLIHPYLLGFMLDRLGTLPLQDQNHCRYGANIHSHYNCECLGHYNLTTLCHSTAHSFASG